jgi:hypothetical protein
MPTDFFLRDLLLAFPVLAAERDCNPDFENFGTTSLKVTFGPIRPIINPINGAPIDGEINVTFKIYDPAPKTSLYTLLSLRRDSERFGEGNTCLPRDRLGVELGKMLNNHIPISTPQGSRFSASTNSNALLKEVNVSIELGTVRSS